MATTIIPGTGWYVYRKDAKGRNTRELNKGHISFFVVSDHGSPVKAYVIQADGSCRNVVNDKDFGGLSYEPFIQESEEGGEDLRDLIFLAAEALAEELATRLRREAD
jgi:hypothetical protein